MHTRAFAHERSASPHLVRTGRNTHARQFQIAWTRKGYQQQKDFRSVLLRTWIRTCRSCWAPFLVHLICCFLAKCLLMISLTVDSTKADEKSSFSLEACCLGFVQ